MEASPSLILYAIGVVNTLLMALLGMAWKTTNTYAAQANTAAAEDRIEMKEAMHLIVADLKTLNDAVLGEYCKKTDLEELKKEFARVEETRRMASAEFRKELHRFELALVAKGVAVPAEGKLDA
jgi:hypothetical protein